MFPHWSSQIQLLI